MPDITANRHRGDEFSVLANENAENSKSKDRARIHAFVNGQPQGATCEEIEAGLRMAHQTASARCSEMRRDGSLQWDGQSKRRTSSGSWARVLTAVDEEADNA
jgi:hypothetical protein